MILPTAVNETRTVSSPLASTTTTTTTGSNTEGVLWSKLESLWGYDGRMERIRDVRENKQQKAV